MPLLLLWFFVVGLIAGIASLSLAFLMKEGERLQTAFVLLGLAAIGVTVGITGGLSRESAVGDIMSAVLGLFGGLAVYLFAADRANGALVSICAFVFSLSVYVGYLEGAGRRNTPESYLYWRATCVEKYFPAITSQDAKAAAFADLTMGNICGAVFKNERDQLLPGKAK